jgi:hypothetical protein
VYVTPEDFEARPLEPGFAEVAKRKDGRPLMRLELR